MRFLEGADLARAAAAAVLGAEHLLLDAVRRHRRRIENDERALGTRRLHMDDAGGQLLAGAGRAADEDAAVGRRHAVERIAQLVDGRRLPDHVSAEARALAQLLHLALELRGFERAQRHEDQPVRLERLFDVVVGAALDGGYRGLDVAVTGDDHHRQIGVCPLDVRQHFEAIEPAALQPDVEYDEMRAPLLDRLEGFVAVTRQACIVPLVLEDAGDEIADVRFVVDDQDVCSHR